MGELPTVRKKVAKNKSSMGLILLKGRTFIALIILLIAFSFIAPNFLSYNSLSSIGKHVALYGILAIGMTFVIITGGIDLSVGAIVGLSGMIAGGLINSGLKLSAFGLTIYFSIPVICIITVILGALIGLINGLIITKCNVAPFIATLGTMYIARGFANLRNNGATFPNLIGTAKLKNTGFEVLGGGYFLHLPVAIWIMIVLAVIAAFALKRTPLGWHILAIGGNKKASELSGVRVQKVTTYVYMFSGFCSAIVGLIVASELVAAHPASGTTWEMNAITAAVLGGTSMAGGIGTVGGTIIGAFVIGILCDGMVMVGVSEFWQMVITGLVIVLAVIVDQFQRKLQAKVALESSREK